MPKIVDADAERAKIREAALKVFARRGLAGTALGYVAAEAGISRASLYHYYTDKAALIDDVAQHLLKEEAEIFASAAQAQGPVRQRLLALSEAVIARFDQWAGLGRPLLEIWARNADALRPLLHGLRTSLAKLIAEGQRQGEVDPDLDPLATAAVMIGLIDGLMLQVFVDPHGAPSGAQMHKALAQALERVLGRPGGPS